MPSGPIALSEPEEQEPCASLQVTAVSGSVPKLLWVGHGGPYMTGESELLGRSGPQSSKKYPGERLLSPGHAVLVRIPTLDLGPTLQARNSRRVAKKQPNKFNNGTEAKLRYTVVKGTGVSMLECGSTWACILALPPAALNHGQSPPPLSFSSYKMGMIIVLTS